MTACPTCGHDPDRTNARQPPAYETLDLGLPERPDLIEIRDNLAEVRAQLTRQETE